MTKHLLKWIFVLTLCTNFAQANTPPIGKETTNTYIVDQQGHGDFTTIQAAINATVNDKDVILFIKPGKYKEKLFITRNNISLIGSAAKNTIIEYAELRNNWRENHSSDWGAAVININASDVNIINLSVINNYGRLHNTDDHQFAIRGFENANRIILHQCSIIADGADTVSLWNKNNGMYYHSYCHFEGHTDMVCPRGWALIEHSTFFNKKKSATLWHDGELNQNQKLVVNNSYFDGIKGFWLGRHHYDAQFYILNSAFSENMADKAIFKKTYEDIERIKPNLYGSRYFFFNNQADNLADWAANNFNPDKTHLKNQSIESWVFNKQWYPNQVIAELSTLVEAAGFPADKLNKLSNINELE
ncbi:MAG: pectinesterase family protein [Thalassotalea sp.]